MSQCYKDIKIANIKEKQIVVEQARAELFKKLQDLENEKIKLIQEIASHNGALVTYVQVLDELEVEEIEPIKDSV